ncbi:MAG: hypothetical protein Q4A67_02490 [Aerococcus sp.]|nr:hypothetical protein [Aerococcus sp.]
MQNPTSSLVTWFPRLISKQVKTVAVPTLTTPPETLATPADLHQAIRYYHKHHQLMALTVSRQMGHTVTRDRLLGYFQTDNLAQETLVFNDVDNQIQRLIPYASILTLEPLED